jgi:hypothetical protein
MAVRNDFTAGEVLAAADLNDTFGAKADTTALDGKLNTTVTTKGDLISRSSSTPTRLGVGSNGQVLTANSATTTGLAWTTLATGKILQVVRATDSTDRTTTSTSFVDVTGMSVTITPQNNNSAILLIASVSGDVKNTGAGTGTTIAFLQITDNSNNAISGAQSNLNGQFINSSTGHEAYFSVSLFAYATPATTSAVTYKLRFRSNAAAVTAALRNASATGQMYAIEVSA